MKKIIVLSIITAITLVVTPMAYADDFKDEFNTLNNWYLVVFDSFGGSQNDPPPVLDPSMGSGPPSLDVNGDGWCGNGAYSMETFDYAEGLIIEWDMFVGPGPNGWNWARGGLSEHLPNLSSQRSDGAYIDSTRCDTHFLAEIQLISSNFNPTPFVKVSIIREDGTGEGLVPFPDATSLLNAWHHYTINIRTDGYVEFYLDNMLLYTTSGMIDRSRGMMPVVFGDRDLPGPVRIDNVSVMRAVIPVNVDIKPGSEPNCINNNGHGVIPVAILGDSTINVRDIDPGSVMLEGMKVKSVGKNNKLLAHYEDVNSDGYEDLVVQIQDSDGALSAGTAVATLSGSLHDGTPIEGSDSVCLVP